MAVCAIVAARLRNGATFLLGGTPFIPITASERFYQAASDHFPHDLSEARAFDYKRAKALLAILCIQYGLVAEHLTHLGEYQVLGTNDGFHDEARWPQELSEAELQEWRRVVSL